MVLEYSKLKIVILVFLSIMALGMAASIACSTPSSFAPNEVSVKESDTGKEVKVAVGGTLTVELDSNPSTGFKWELMSISDPGVVEKTGEKFEAAMIKRAEGSPPIVGAPGRELWTFKALKKGKSGVSMQYSQPWTGDTKGVRSFDLTVVVE